MIHLKRTVLIWYYNKAREGIDMKKWDMPEVVALDINATANGELDSHYERNVPHSVTNQTYKNITQKPNVNDKS